MRKAACNAIGQKMIASRRFVFGRPLSLLFAKSLAFCNPTDPARLGIPIAVLCLIIFIHRIVI
jgi:hypothetical protein